ncbi:YccF domain-containing protein [Limnohabitans sp. Rim8]|uniref:YccF domain-containing protein n=1 Tax=Limnohabitans sp. Rim8 TaxID=1100718 RepID=UPI0025E5F9F2|nr:YccF domain-containing protein [Limnohabitans sp. Rim8]
MRAIGNFLWFIFGGVFMGLVLRLVFLIAFFSIMGIPLERARMFIGNFTFFQFEREPISRKEFKQ